MEAKFPLLLVFKLLVHARRAHESFLILNYDTETVNPERFQLATHSEATLIVEQIVRFLK